MLEDEEMPLQECTANCSRHPPHRRNQHRQLDEHDTHNSGRDPLDGAIIERGSDRKLDKDYEATSSLQLQKKHAHGAEQDGSKRREQEWISSALSYAP
jgi:hypothetical protein